MIKLIGKYLKSYIGYICGAFVLIVAQIVIQMIFLMGETKRILDVGVANGDMKYITTSAIKMLIFTLLLGICTIGISYLTSKVSGIFLCHMRRDCYKKVLSLTPEDFDYFGGATLLTRTTDDPKAIVNLAQFLMGRVIMMPVVIICILFMVFKNSKSSFTVLIVAVLMAAIIMVVLEIKARPRFKVLQDRIDRLNLLVREKITGVRSIRAFGNEAFEEEKGIQADKDIYDAAIDANRPMKFMNPLTLIIINWAIVLIYYCGTKEIQKELTSISSLILIFQYLSYFLMALSLIPTLVTMLPKAQVSGMRVSELLEYESKAGNELSDSEAEVPADGSIEFRNVTFKYENGRTVLNNVSFRVEDGGQLAIIGSTGAGKSTLLNLIMGFYKIDSGEILIGGVPIEKINRKQLLEMISYSAQKAYVFQDTVRNNITAFHNEISDEVIEQACVNACFDDVLGELDNGYETQMTQGGMNISGGQRKRLALARALAKDSKIYLLDDPFAALDAITEKKVKERSFKWLEDKTTVIVSSKIATVVEADAILVINNGAVVGCGKHEYLLEECNLYSALYETQCYLEGEE